MTRISFTTALAFEKIIISVYGDAVYHILFRVLDARALVPVKPFA